MKLIRNLVFSFIALFVAFPAAAQSVEVLAKYDDWTAFSFVEKGSKVCYMASTPSKDEGQYTRRGDIFAIVTHRPAENSYDVVNFVAGYTYKKASDVKVSVGSKSFTLFTHDDTAWARNAATDEDLVKAMINGNRMIVRGVSSRGTDTKDTYSLKGFTNTHEAINRACQRK